MKQFIAFVKKEFLHILRDRRTVLILIVMPIAQILLFGFAISTEVNNVRLAVLDESKDQSTQRIIDRFSSNKYFELKLYASDYPSIEAAFMRGDIDVAVIFGTDFEKNLTNGKASVQLLSDGSDPNTAQAATNYSSSILQMYIQSFMQNNALTPPSLTIMPEIKLLYNPQMVAAYNFVPGVMGLILTLICAMMTAIAIVREKERGTMEVLLVSPLRPIFIILAKVTPYFVLSCLNVLTILLLAVFVFDVPIVGSLLLLAVFCIVFIFTALALGIFISSLVSSQVTAMMISGMALMMPTTMLAGLMFPIESMPEILQIISNIIPAKWFISAVRKIMIQGAELRYVYVELSVLLGMALLLTVVSLKKFNKRLE